MTMHVRTGGVCTTTTNSLKRSACGKLPMVNPPTAAANYYTTEADESGLSDLRFRQLSDSLRGD
jgi:hypothetical protein